ncbi:melanoma cell adhesion molecule b isoform X2 [Poecilia reticulata]|uniref:melanoma cell adhesion molecule b isoform X2 n=1 Tax=Poecilia reticulata TaxID=8081 RepID=UPI0004A4FBFB|nr:PREDICTED: cell surface glycoprotein MUC18 isoform X2 [Poecilia reticulata]
MSLSECLRAFIPFLLQCSCLPPSLCIICLLTLLLSLSLSLSAVCTEAVLQVRSRLPLNTPQHTHLCLRPTTMAVRDAASPLLLGLLCLLHTWGARATVEVNMEDKVEAVLGDTARITCMFKSQDFGGSGGMTIKWYYVKNSKEIKQIYSQDSLQSTVEKNTPYSERITVDTTGTVGEVVLTIRDVQLSDDEVAFNCYVKIIGEGTGEGTTKLKVFKTPEDPTIQGVEQGISVSDEMAKIASCEVENGYPKPKITWYRDKMPLHNIPDVVKVDHRVTSKSSGLYSVNSDLNMKVEKKDKDAVFYCEVTFLVPGAEKMLETNSINITVFYPPTTVNLWVESPKGKIKEGDTVEFLCASDGNSESQFFMIDNNEGPRLKMENVTRHNSRVYVCVVEDFENSVKLLTNTSVFVNYLDEVVIEPTGSVLVDWKNEFLATCNALSSLRTKTTWFKNGKEVEKGHHLSLKAVTYDTAGTYDCVVTVPEIQGMQANASLQVTVQGPPEIIEKHLSEAETNERELELTCHVRSYPTPNITWGTTNGKIISSSNHMTNVGAKSVAKVQVNITSNTNVFCNASNKFGKDSVTYVIKFTKAETPKPQEKAQKGSYGVVIPVIIICILLLAILGSVLYFLYKKGKICNRSGKKDFTKEKSSKDKIVVEMKSDNTEEAILLGVNGEKQLPNDQ